MTLDRPAAALQPNAEWKVSFHVTDTSGTARTLFVEADTNGAQIYGKAKYERLVALKRKYDPDNFFRLNQNIKP